MNGILNWSKRRPTRSGAFGIHLLLSLLVFSSLVAVMALFWFPGDLLFIDGGWQGLKMVAVVVVVIGPILTLILFKPGNPSLMLDTSVVVAIQFAALGYGFYTAHQQRTVAIVYAGGGFNTLSAQDNVAADKQLLALNRQPKPLPAAPMLHVPLLHTPTAADGNYRQILEDVLHGFPAPQERSDHYDPLAAHHDAMRVDALDQDQLAKRGASQVVQRALERRSLKPEDVELYKFRARFESGIAVFDPDTLQIVDFVVLDEQALFATGTSSGDTL